MHICFLTHEYPLWATGGIGSFVQTFGRALVRCGHCVTVVGVGQKKELVHMNDEGIELYRLPHSGRKRFAFIPNVIRIRRFLKDLHKKQPIDIVESPEAGLAFVARSTPYRKVIRLHGGHHFFAESENRPVQWWKGLQEKWSFRNADGFIAVSKYVQTHTGKYLSYHQKPIAVVGLPVDSGLFSSDGSAFVPYRLVFAGTVCEKKGIRQLIQALPKVIEKYPQVELCVYGRDWYFPNKKSYIAMLKETIPPDILAHVKFMGTLKRPEMPDAYRKGHICIFPSHMETLGLVAPEAMLTGRPVIFTMAGPGPEVVEHGVTGLLCNPHNPSDIAEKILYAFDHPSEMEEMARAGRRFVLHTFDADRLVVENLAFYNSLR
ncbi:MAG: glycosyltransferase family 4 protein [Breznakibacter sp.]